MMRDVHGGCHSFHYLSIPFIPPSQIQIFEAASTLKVSTQSLNHNAA